MSIFKERLTYKPSEYPEADELRNKNIAATSDSSNPNVGDYSDDGNYQDEESPFQNSQDGYANYEEQ